MQILIDIVGKEAIKTAILIGIGLVAGKLTTMKTAKVDTSNGHFEAEW